MLDRPANEWWPHSAAPAARGKSKTRRINTTPVRKECFQGVRCSSPAIFHISDWEHLPRKTPERTTRLTRQQSEATCSKQNFPSEPTKTPTRPVKKRNERSKEIKMCSSRLCCSVFIYSPGKHTESRETMMAASCPHYGATTPADTPHQGIRSGFLCFLCCKTVPAGMRRKSFICITF